jgi:hypothetical protein
MQGFKTQLKIIHLADDRSAYQRLKDLLAMNVIAATHSLLWRQMTVGKMFTWVPEV